MELHEYCLDQLQMGQSGGICQNTVARIRSSISSIFSVDSLHHAGRDSSMLLNIELVRRRTAQKPPPRSIVPAPVTPRDPDSRFDPGRS
jgi:hypothetical protein